MSDHQSSLPGIGQPIRIKGGTNAYPAMPGTGPDGETCKTCRFSHFRGHGKRYWKCELVKTTNGPGTDIRVGSPACHRWGGKE